MANFKLDTSTLGSGSYKTVPVTIDSGNFRTIQLHFDQSVLSQDMEVHYLELHFTLTGVSKEDL